MTPKAKQLCDLLEQRKRDFAGSRFEAHEWECSLTVGTTRVTIDEVQNSDPPIVNVNVGTTISRQAVADPADLPQPNSGRYQAAAGGGTVWQGVVTGEEFAPEELISAAVRTLEDYVEQAGQ